MSDYPQVPSKKSKLFRPGLLRSSIFHRALMLEFASMGILIFFVLLSILAFTQLVRLLGKSASGAFAVDGVWAILGFGALNYLPTVLSISLFLSVLLTLTRSYRDNEMVVWFCSGIGLTRWVRPVLCYALPVIGLIALLSLVLSPWAVTKVEELKRRLESRDDVSAATPGIFRESKHADRVFFIENVDLGKNRVGNIFVQTLQHEKVGTMVAKEGLQETAANGDRFLVLLNGTRYEGVPGQLDFRIVEFERYAIRIKAVEAKERPAPLNSLATTYLLSNLTLGNLSELERRLSLPVSALILTLLAIPLSFVNPRAGRSLNLIVAIFIYMIYNNMISVVNSLVGQGKIDPGVGFWGIHGLMFMLLVLLFYRRMTIFSLRRIVKR